MNLGFVNFDLSKMETERKPRVSRDLRDIFLATAVRFSESDRQSGNAKDLFGFGKISGRSVGVAFVVRQHGCTLAYAGEEGEFGEVIV